MLTKQLAYEKWLGIKSQDQPPTLYRLLGVDAFESDPDTISYAADARMALLRQFQISENAKLAEQILGELAKARVQLLNPGKKAAYDAELRAQSAASAAENRPAEPLDPASTQNPTEPGGSVQSRSPPAVKKNRHSLLWIALASFAVTLAVLAVVMSPSGNKDLPARDTSKEEAHPAEAKFPQGKFLTTFDNWVYLDEIKDHLLNRKVQHADSDQYVSPVEPNETFDEAWYLEKNPDVKASYRTNNIGKTPAEDHWIVHGKAEGRLGAPLSGRAVGWLQTAPGVLKIDLSNGRFEVWTFDEAGHIAIKHWATPQAYEKSEPPKATGKATPTE